MLDRGEEIGRLRMNMMLCGSGWRGGEDPVDGWISMDRGRRRSRGGGDLDNDEIEDARRRIGEDEEISQWRRISRRRGSRRISKLEPDVDDLIVLCWWAKMVA